MLDLDHFKSINDRYGHHVGDRVLERVAEVLVAHVRAGDLVARTGGEEFVILMPRTGDDVALACCERLREALRAEPWGEIALGLELTASIGVISAPQGGDLDVLARDADNRLYSAKRTGRDRTIAAPMSRDLRV